MELIRKFIFLFKSARVYLNYHLNEKFPKFSKFVHIRRIPFLVIMNPTFSCNLKCKYCENKFLDSKKTLSLKTLYRLVDQISALNIPVISFSGGEPLLIKNIEKIGKYARKKNILVNLNTNGILIDKNRAKRIANSFDLIRISLDGVGKDHDDVCGVKGTYKRVINNIRYLTSLPHRTSKIGINCVINKENFEKINTFNETLHKKVDFISFLPEISFCHKYKYNASNSNKIKNLYDKTKNLEHPVTFLNDSMFFLNKCDAGKLYFTISPGGFVFACPFVPQEFLSFFKFGSLYEECLFDIINKKKKIIFSDYCDGCYANCTTEISRLFRMNIFELLKNFHSFRKFY